MNSRTLGDIGEHWIHRAQLIARLFDPVRRASVFSADHEPDALRRIYVINLDRKSDRWHRVRRELDRFRERGGKSLLSITRRFSAVDARYLREEPDTSVLDATFTLAEQLTVHPNPLLKVDDTTRAVHIDMTKQEKAVALSHIEVWRLVANGDVPSALILEDDVVLLPGFAESLRTIWSRLVAPSGTYDFDLLYLAYRDVSLLKPSRAARLQRRLTPGLWEASAYVLTREGAKALLAELPVRGPVDLWFNMQFENLRVYASPRKLVEQRFNEPSTNSYSVLPVLSQVGAITREKPLLPAARRLMGPIIAVGPPSSGLSALAKALSMLGYTCLSDADGLSANEIESLKRDRATRFNAYVNVGELDEATAIDLASHNRRVRFIATSDDITISLPAERTLRLPPSIRDKWVDLSEFLDVDYPAFSYPDDVDQPRQTISQESIDNSEYRATDLKFDRSPWILRRPLGKCGIDNASELSPQSLPVEGALWRKENPIEQEMWRFRDDTFPSNLALFRADNLHEKIGEPTLLTLRNEATTVRDFSSAAIASRSSYLYGSFSAELRPSNVSGLITGLFLHRNGPRQEIDIEFLGKDTTKMLVNVYFNPGPQGTKLEYGYRGTPTEIDLGFDAADKSHLYEIDWRPDQIIWRVDGKVVYRRHTWSPTPIPDQPLEFNINLWHSRSTEFAGRLDSSRLPAEVEIHSMQIETSANVALMES